MVLSDDSVVKSDLGASGYFANIAEEAARTAGRYLRSNFGSRVRTDYKDGYFDVVTEHDRHAEQIIVDSIFEAHVDSKIIGEESAPRGDGSAVWFIDPIDGTSNFVAGFPFYCVSIGVQLKGQMVAAVIYDPERDELFRADEEGATLNGSFIETSSAVTDEEALCLIGWPYEGRSSGVDEVDASRAVRGSYRAVRSVGSAALSLAYVAAGRADVCSELLAQPWDVAAGFLMVEKAGGGVARAAAVGKSASNQVKDWLAPRYVAHGRLFELTESSIARVLR